MIFDSLADPLVSIVERVLNSNPLVLVGSALIFRDLGGRINLYRYTLISELINVFFTLFMRGASYGKDL